jgi:lysyl-tRNA synthetase class 1
MFWADRIAREIVEKQQPGTDQVLLIRDEKTLSGRVHIGSMRGVAIHGLVGEVLTEMGVKNEYRFELNDFDPFDSIPPFLDQERFKEHLGKPLYTVPSPVEGFENFADYFGKEFVAVHKKAGFFPSYYKATELYQSGKMDPFIKLSLERAADIRRILKEVSGSQKPDTWLPVSIICENCGKMMTTRSTDYDGETVGYTCDIGPDETVPCGHKGRVSPYGGNTKLFWKADWAAKWCALNVDIEGAGKDHSTKGGSRDVAKHISKEVFNREAPFDIPYEFFLTGGKKMSSSKGRGSSAHDMGELFPTRVLRLALLGKDINQQIDIDPAGDAIPRTYDWHDELAEAVRNGVTDDFTRLYELTKLPEERAGSEAPWLLRFSQVAFITQMPHISLQSEAEAVKGSPLTDEEQTLMDERESYAKFWLSNYAPEEYKYQLQDTLPRVELGEKQREALTKLTEYLAEKRSGEEIQTRLHELKTEIGIKPQELFSALYKIFLNRDSGPKIGWFLSVLPHDFVLSRIEEASS